MPAEAPGGTGPLLSRRTGGQLARFLLVGVSTASAVLREVVRDGVARAVAVVGLVGVALIHLLDLPGTFDEQAYKGWLYLGLVAGCVATAVLLVRGDDRRGWLAAALLPLAAMLGFVLSRTVGLPGGADDIGNWGEPLGIAALFVEGCLAALADFWLSEPDPTALSARLDQPPLSLRQLPGTPRAGVSAR